MALVMQVSWISSLQALWRLDLGRNQLTSCVDVGNFASIEQLSVDNNQISSLKVPLLSASLFHIIISISDCKILL